MRTVLSGLGLASLLIIGPAAHADSVTGSAQNQSTPTVSAVGQLTAQSASSDQGGAESGSMASGGPNGGLTRQEVREQLIQAENDGQLKALNATLYSRP
jgi:hypothetical protein